MQIIEGSYLSSLCDYSFGDHLGGIDPINLPGGFMKLANDTNVEFLNLCKQFEGRIMTLFIDNIRLYNRTLWVNPGPDVQWVTWLLTYNDLLALCKKLPNNQFIIFTSHEDTPIDDQIVVPSNVLGIHAVNAIFNTEKICPFPIGLQREIGTKDNRLEIMTEWVENKTQYEPTKLLYINCGLGSERNEEERAYLPTFSRFEWATTRFEKNSKFYAHHEYDKFLREIQDHKFMICPKGHGMDCHRNWETLYMRRVPIFKDHPYFRQLMGGFPALFVNDWEDITPKLLINNDFLYQKAQTMDLNMLDLNLRFDTIKQSYAITM